MKLTGWFQVVLGLAILAVWILLLTTGGVPEIAAGQRDIWFHMAAEGMTGLLLIGAGLALLRKRGTRARVLSAFALGALLYTAVDSPGYYADKGEWAPVGMFVGLVLAVAAIAVNLVRSSDHASEAHVVLDRELHEALR